MSKTNSMKKCAKSDIQSTKCAKCTNWYENKKNIKKLKFAVLPLENLRDKLDSLTALLGNLDAKFSEFYP